MKTPNDSSSDPLRDLDTDQRARVAALHQAHAVSSASTVLGSTGADTLDLITIASWIIDGEDPWPIRSTDPQGVNAVEEGRRFLTVPLESADPDWADKA